MSLKYTIYAADRAGESWDVAQLSDSAMALLVLGIYRNKHPEWVFGAYDTDNVEGGDIEAELEELVAAAGRCAWCGRLDADGHDLDAHNRGVA